MAEQSGTGGLPGIAPKVSQSYSPGGGTSVEHEWSGAAADVLAKFDQLRADSVTSSGTGELTLEGMSYNSNRGHATVVARFVRRMEDGGANTSPEYGLDVTVVEELISVEALRPLADSKYFEKLSDGNAFSAEKVAWVQKTVENGWTEADINTHPGDSESPGDAWKAYSEWDSKMKELRGHMVRGVLEFYDTQFIFRRTLQGGKTAPVNIDYLNVNSVVERPSFLTDLSTWIDQLPQYVGGPDEDGSPSTTAGEWVKRCPTLEYDGQGQWRATEEYQLAEKWSVVYGGSFTGGD